MHLLLIFIKNPRPGYVKTRLARTVGDAEALRIYHILLARTRQAATAAHAQRWLCYSDAVEEHDEWPAADFRKCVQHPGDLGHRMQQAFAEAFAAGADKVVIIGSDCPALTGPAIDEAFQALDTDDFVVGPTFDGGYYLLGMRAFTPAVFADIAWSTDAVLPATLARIAGLGQTAALLPTLSDVDTEEDLGEIL
jgi:uncharacterized protein